MAIISKDELADARRTFRGRKAARRLAWTETGALRLSAAGRERRLPVGWVLGGAAVFGGLVGLVWAFAG